MSEKKGAVVTIDGPSGSGKSTISRMLAARLHYTYLDTGAMYRAVGLKVRQAGIDLDNPADRPRLVKLLAELDLQLALAARAGEETRVFLDGEEISAAIRTAEMGLVASRVSAEPVVRQKLTEMQRQFGLQGGVVAEGRDTGTVVFPQAAYKFYLDASPEERARRRWEQLREKGQEMDRQEILAQIEKRDRDDSSRALAPLSAAPDAIIIDSSVLSVEAVVEVMLARMAPA
ncbi:MAG: cytidylate kinase [Deltaproteobacteria bacterium RIFOXYD12_FULL_57_12]|nr:MAG: cytidylate kinase [Deltaproteobacteria bacterium RIFOXYD12_FULL_57_12]